MLRHAFTAVVFVAIGVARDRGCSDVDDPDGGPNAPCTRSSDCGSSLVCQEGVCRERDGGSGASDGGDGASSSSADGG